MGVTWSCFISIISCDFWMSGTDNTRGRSRDYQSGDRLESFNQSYYRHFISLWHLFKRKNLLLINFKSSKPKLLLTHGRVGVYYKDLVEGVLLKVTIKQILKNIWHKRVFKECEHYRKKKENLLDKVREGFDREKDEWERPSTGGFRGLQGYFFAHRLPFKYKT